MARKQFGPASVTYQKAWKKDSEFKGKASAELVQDEMDTLAKLDPNGKITNKAMVDFAQRHPVSELYKCFEWDDGKAAHRYRLTQAQHIKTDIVTVPVQITGTPTVTPAITMEVVTNHALPTPGEGHKNIEIILQSKIDTAALDQEMYDAIKVFCGSFQRRFNLAPSFQKYDILVQQLLNSLP